MEGKDIHMDDGKLAAVRKYFLGKLVNQTAPPNEKSDFPFPFLNLQRSKRASKLIEKKEKELMLKEKKVEQRKKEVKVQTRDASKAKVVEDTSGDLKEGLTKRQKEKENNQVIGLKVQNGTGLRNDPTKIAQGMEMKQKKASEVGSHEENQTGLKYENMVIQKGPAKKNTNRELDRGNNKSVTPQQEQKAGIEDNVVEHSSNSLPCLSTEIMELDNAKPPNPDITKWMGLSDVEALLDEEEEDSSGGRLERRRSITVDYSLMKRIQ